MRWLLSLSVAVVILMASALLQSCAAEKSVAPPSPNPIAEAAPAERTSPRYAMPLDHCQEAARLREQGAKQFAALDLGGAQASFLASLKYDPDNTGAIEQLDLVDAAIDGKQVGLVPANSARHSSSYRTGTCQGDAGLTSASGKRAVHGGIDVQNDAAQIIIIAEDHAYSKTDLSRKEIAKAMARATRDLVQCYGLSPAAGNQTIPIEFVVKASGQVGTVRAQAGPSIRECLEAAVAKVNFRKRPSGTLSIIDPLIFSIKS